ncbi:MAG: FitA-like ribbon-helix-helix domain-containing protein [Pseudomonadota bacterium]
MTHAFSAIKIMSMMQAPARMHRLAVRNLEPELVERLRLRARRNGRSLEAEVRVILAEAAPVSRAEVVGAVEVLRARIASRGPVRDDSTTIIRAARDREI